MVHFGVVRRYAYSLSSFFQKRQKPTPPKFIGKSRTLKRIKYHARGRFGLEKRFSSRLTLVLRHKSQNILQFPSFASSPDAVELEQIRAVMRKRNVYLPMKELNLSGGLGKSGESSGWKKVRGVKLPWDETAWKYVRKSGWTAQVGEEDEEMRR